MTQASNSAACGGDTEDKISSLPGDVVHHILEFVPIKDGARTCILSKKWRYLWAELPNLVLDKHFCSELTVKSHYVDKILLHHIGDIVKFDLDVSGINLSSDTHIDSWLFYVTRNGVKRLTLIMPDGSIYKIPSYVFNCHSLTHLELTNSVFKPPSASLDFQNLTTLYLEKISFVPTSRDLVIIINGQFLSNLTLKYCTGTQCLNVVSPKLSYLDVCSSHFDIGLSCFMNCKNVGVLHLQAENPLHVDRSTLEKLLCSLPILAVLTFNLHFLELLSIDIIPSGLPFTLDYLWHLRLLVDFCKVAQVSFALELIKGSPNLNKLEIWVCSTGDGGEVLSYLDMPTYLDRPLNNLKNVVVHWFKGSKIELGFVKLLFAHAPSLVRMSIEESTDFSTAQKNVMLSLMQFRRASPEAELFYVPSSS